MLRKVFEAAVNHIYNLHQDKGYIRAEFMLFPDKLKFISKKIPDYDFYGILSAWKDCCEGSHVKDESKMTSEKSSITSFTLDDVNYYYNIATRFIKNDYQALCERSGKLNITANKTQNQTMSNNREKLNVSELTAVIKSGDQQINAANEINDAASKNADALINDLPENNEKFEKNIKSESSTLSGDDKAKKTKSDGSLGEDVDVVTEKGADERYLRQK